MSTILALTSSALAAQSASSQLVGFAIDQLAAVNPGARVIVFGHLAVGNLHVNVLGPGPEDERVDDAILALVIEHGGSIAAEHGIGRAKARWLTRARPAWELALQAAIKQALDPAGIFNPGVLDPAPTNRADGHAAPAGRPGPDGR